jgi:hypothetical protein
MLAHFGPLLSAFLPIWLLGLVVGWLVRAAAAGESSRCVARPRLISSGPALRPQLPRPAKGQSSSFALLSAPLGLRRLGLAVHVACLVRCAAGAGQSRLGGAALAPAADPARPVCLLQGVLAADDAPGDRAGSDFSADKLDARPRLPIRSSGVRGRWTGGGGGRSHRQHSRPGQLVRCSHKLERQQRHQTNRQPRDHSSTALLQHPLLAGAGASCQLPVARQAWGRGEQTYAMPRHLNLAELPAVSAHRGPVGTRKCMPVNSVTSHHLRPALPTGTSLKRT